MLSMCSVSIYWKTALFKLVTRLSVVKNPLQVALANAVSVVGALSRSRCRAGELYACVLIVAGTVAVFTT